MKISELFPEAAMEDQEYEFKSILNQDNPVKWAKTIVAYANGKGGTLFVGVSNDGTVFGIDLEEVDRTKNLVTLVNDRNIFPHAKISYSIRSVDETADHFVLGIIVFAAESVVRYREGDFNETVYVRGSEHSTPATPEQIISLSKRRYGVDNETSDIRYKEDQWQEYLSLCREYRRDESEPTFKELQNEEIVSEHGFAKSGFLMFRDGYDAEDTMICCRLWKGISKTATVLDSARYKGSIANALTNTLRFIERNTKSGWRKTEDGGREELRSYPKEAIREVLVNAIAHRDYSIAGTQIDVDIYTDRMVVVSPGSWLLPKGYAEYPLGSIPSIRRNSIIAACLDVANLMERGGTGFQTIMESYADCPLELQPVVSIYPGFLSLKLYDKLHEIELFVEHAEYSIQDRVLGLLRENGSMPVRELQEALQFNSRARFLADVINPMIASGVIYRDGKTKSPHSVIRIKPQ